MKASPFFLHRFFATNFVQRVVFQIVAVKGEGKNGKFAECAGAYIRVGACPARRIEWILCGVGRFEIKQGRKSRKVEKF